MGSEHKQCVPCLAQVNCCGWASFYNWTDNAELMNRPEVTYPCSCEKKGEEDNSLSMRKGFCETAGNRTQRGNNPEDWPVYQEVCGGRGAVDWGLGSEGVGGRLGYCSALPSSI